MLNIRRLLTGLADNRKVFHSEADFQHALAWHIHQTMPKSQIRLEFPVPVEHRKMYVDIWLPEQKTAIELKYVTRSSELEHNEESFTLRNHGAHPPRRYDFLRDIQRLERMRSVPELCEAGHAVLLTNDPLYWNPPGRLGYGGFRLPRSRGTGDTGKTGMDRRSQSGNEEKARETDTTKRSILSSLARLFRLPW